jgi:hypothetical protein
MFTSHNERRQGRLTTSSGGAHNAPTRRKNNRGKTRGTLPHLYGLRATRCAWFLDLAGVRPVRFKVPALHSTYWHAASATRLRLSVAHNRHVWRPRMAKAMNGTVATAPGGALWRGGHPGVAQPPLDLSLGHLGTRDSFGEAAELVEEIGPFRVVFYPATGQSRIFTDRSAFANREERRAAEKEFRKAAARIARETGFAVSKGGAS